jgi:hypothetical protein
MCILVKDLAVRAWIREVKDDEILVLARLKATAPKQGHHIVLRAQHENLQRTRAIDRGLAEHQTEPIAHLFELKRGVAPCPLASVGARVRSATKSTGVRALDP